MTKNDPKKVSGKDMLSSMNQFKEIYMNDFFRNNTNPTSVSAESAIILENVDKSYIEVNSNLIKAYLTYFSIEFYYYRKN